MGFAVTQITLDTTGHICPIPVLKLRRVVKSLGFKDKVVMIATDVGTKRDVHYFCKENSCKIASFSEKDGILTFHIIVGEAQ